MKIAAIVDRVPQAWISTYLPVGRRPEYVRNMIIEAIRSLKYARETALLSEGTRLVE